MAIKVLPYRQGSRSARLLAQTLGGRVLRLEGSRWRPRRADLVINWGNTDTTRNVGPARLLQQAASIHSVSNKRRFFELCSANGVEESVPEYWTDRNAIPDDAFARGGVVCRTVLAGHSGEGIVIALSRDELVPAQLYTKYIKKSQEYRIHLGRWLDQSITTISIQRKARSRDVEDEAVNWQVRNHQNGFIYVRGDANPPACAMDVARAVFAASDLDFGAVDVIYNERNDRAYVLEINTAPGLEGQTVEDYADFFRNF